MISLDGSVLDRKRETGASAVEYSFLVAAIAAVIVVVAWALGSVTAGTYSKTCGNLKSEISTSQNC